MLLIVQCVIIIYEHKHRVSDCSSTFEEPLVDDEYLVIFFFNVLLWACTFIFS